MEQLIINGEYVDMLESTSIAQTFQVNDIAELKDRQGNYTNQFKLPKTDRNMRIFGYSNTLASGSSSPYTQLDATIVIDGIPTVQNGRASVTAVGKEFEVTIYSGNVGFFSSLDGKKLSDLDTTAFDLMWDDTMTSIYGRTQSPSLIIVDDSTLDDTLRRVNLRTQYPSMFFADIFRLIHEQAGYDVDTELLNDSFFLAEFLPFTNDYPKVGEADREATKISAVCSAESQSVASGQRLPMDALEVGSPANYNTLNFSYTCTNAAEYKVSARSLIRKIGGVWLYQRVAVNGSSRALIGSGIHNGIYYAMEFKDFIVQLDVGDVLTVQIVGDDPMIFYNDDSAFPFPEGKTSYLKIEAAEKLRYGGNFNFAVNFPDLSQKDFVKAIMQEYALIPQVDDLSKTISYKRFEDIAGRKGLAKDWSKYLAQEVKDVPIYFHPNGYAQVNYLRFKEDENVTPLLGDGTIDVNDETLQPKRDQFTLPFAASDTVTKLNGFQLALIDRTKSREPRTLRYNLIEIIDGNGGIELHSGGATLSTETNAVIGIFDTSLPIYNGYPREDKYPRFDNNIIDTYYAAVKDMLSKYKRITPQLILPPLEIANLDHFTPVWFDQYSDYFYINKIENYTRGKVCRAELIRI